MAIRLWWLSFNCVAEHRRSSRVTRFSSQGRMGESTDVAEDLFPSKAHDVMAFCVNESFCNS